jgi:hypothetical protein
MNRPEADVVSAREEATKACGEISKDIDGIYAKAATCVLW